MCLNVLVPVVNTMNLLCTTQFYSCELRISGLNLIIFQVEAVVILVNIAYRHSYL